VTLPPQLVTFLCGFGGSVAVEIVLLNQFMQDSATLPERYRKPLFWVVRLLLAVVGGGLALAYEIDKPLLAANIGAATPLIIKAFSEGIRPAVTQLPDAVAVRKGAVKDVAAASALPVAKNRAKAEGTPKAR
jgi:hypothetical protein